MINKFLYLIIFVSMFSFLYVFDIQEVSAWYDSNYTYRRSFTFDGDLIATTTDSFPFLATTTIADLKTTGNGGKVQNASGYDMVWVDSDDTTALDFEVEKYDATTGEIVHWVEASAASSTNKTIYLYYGNSTISTDQSDAAGTWDSNFVMVQHLNESDIDGGAGDIKDSTSNNNDGTTSGMDGSDDIDAYIGTGFDFDGVDDYVDLGGSLPNLTELSLTIWMNPDVMKSWSGPVNYNRVNDVGRRGFQYVNNDGSTTVLTPHLVVTTSSLELSNWYVLDYTYTLATGDWIHHVWTWDGTTARFFVDGIEKTVASGGGSGYGQTTSSIGQGYSDFGGIIDEVRISSSARDAGWIKTEYNNQVDTTTFTTVGSEESSAWYDSNYSYRRSFTFDGDLIATTTDSFPFLATTTIADLKTSGNGGKVENANGYDMVWVDSDNATALDFEVEKYDATTGEIVHWVEASAASSTNKTIYLYYGNPSISTDQSDAEGTWDSNFVMVQHLNESDIDGGAGDIKDSTSNNNDGTTSGMDTNDDVAAQIGTGFDFDGSNDYVGLGTNSDLDLASTNFTITAWIKRNTEEAAQEFIISKDVNGSRGYGFEVSSNKLCNERDGKWVIEDTDATVFLSANTWYFVTLKFNESSNTYTTYVNGVQDGTKIRTGHLSTSAESRIGARAYPGYEGFFGGIIEELRISSSARDAGWIKTEYNNQVDTTTFTTVGSEEVGTVPSTTFDISGTLYTDEGSTQNTAGSVSIKLTIATSTPGVFATTTDSGSGAWSIQGLTQETDVWAGVPISVWVDGDANNRAFTLTKASSTTNDISGVDLYQNRIIVRHEGTSATSTTITDLATYDADDDSDIQFTANGGALVSNAGQELHIWTGDTFAPGGAMTFHGNASTSGIDGGLHIDDNATLTSGGNITFAGNWTADTGSTFTAGSDTVTFNASTSRTITGNSQSFNNLIISGNATTTDSFTVDGVLTIDSGKTLEIASGDIVTSGSSAGSAGPASWYNTDFSYRRSFTFDGDLIATTTDSFPFLATTTIADLKTTGNGGDVTNANGYDMVWVDSDDTTALDFEVEKYDATTGEIVHWVEASAASSTNKTIYLYYGNSTISTDQSDAAGTWDSNFVMVQHLNESDIDGGAGDIKDSTSNNNDGTTSGMDTNDDVAAQIGTGFDFDGTDDYIQTSINGTTMDSFTYSVWFNSDKLTADRAFFDSNSTQRFIFYEYGAFPNKNLAIFEGSENRRFIAGAWDPSSWTYISMTVDGSTGTLYVDGIQTGTTIDTTRLVGDTFDTTLFLMQSYDGARRYGGDFDEVRVSTSIRDAGWIKTEYNNQVDTTTFTTVGSEEEGPVDSVGINGTINGAGTLSIQNSNLGTGGTLSSRVRMDGTGATINIPARTYGGVVEIYSSGSAGQVSLNSGTHTFSSALYGKADGSGNITLDGATNNPTVSITGDLDFTGTGDGSEVMWSGTGAWTMSGNVLDFTGGTFTASSTNAFALDSTVSITSAGNSLASTTISGTATLGDELNISGNALISGTIGAQDYAVRLTGSSKTLYGSTNALGALRVDGSYTLADLDLTVGTTTIASGGTLTVDSGRTLTSTSTLTLEGTLAGTGTTTLQHSNLTSGGTLSNNIRFDATDGDLTMIARTYGGNVEYYNNSGSSARTVTMGAGTFNFSSNLWGNVASTKNITLAGNTNNPTVNVTGNVDFFNP